MSIMTSFFTEFVHTENGVTCSESGFTNIFTEEECARSVDYARSFNPKAYYEFEVNWRYKPKGCLILNDGNSGSGLNYGGMYFNTHITGGAPVKDFANICRRGNSQF